MGGAGAGRCARGWDFICSGYIGSQLLVGSVLSGASARFMAFYERWFANTYKFLPPIDGHPVPGAEHTVILSLLLLVSTFSIIAIGQVFRGDSAGAA
jgi:hypothetical protein